jgi:hypothetical protein
VILSEISQWKGKKIPCLKCDHTFKLNENGERMLGNDSVRHNFTLLFITDCKVTSMLSFLFFRLNVNGKSG